MSLATIQNWHALARTSPTEDDLRVQIGVHLEEVVEMLDQIDATDAGTDELMIEARESLHALAEHIKAGRHPIEIASRKGLLDALCDQIVTAIGVGHCARLKTLEALHEVDRSNWTKVVDGQFLRDANGKIKKPASYQPPCLEGMY